MLFPELGLSLVLSVLLALCTVTNCVLFDHTAATTLAFIEDYVHTVTLTTPIIFYGVSYTTLYVSDNGMVTFDSSFLGNTWPLTTSWIAPFGADIGSGVLKQQLYDASSTVAINQANNLVSEIYPDDGFLATYIVVITWSENKRFSLTVEPEVNTFQLVIATDGSSKSYAIFLYEKIEWFPAQTIGASSGDPNNFYKICDADTPNVRYLPYKSNNQCGTTPGLIVLRIDQTSWSQDFSSINTYTPIACPSASGNSYRDIRCQSPKK